MGDTGWKWALVGAAQFPVRTPGAGRGER